MMNRLKSLGEVEEARRRLAEMLDARGEWFVREGREGAGVRVRRGEWELRAAGGALVLSYWGEAGVRVWRVAAWAQEGEGVVLEASRRAGAERATLILIPRASYAESAAAVSEARRAECARLAALVCRETGAKLDEARLSAGARRGEPGRYARLLLRSGRGRVAATGPVVPLEAEEADAFLSSALLWLARLEEKAGARGKTRAKRPVELWLVARSKLCAAVGERIALLREGVRRSVSLFEVDEGVGVEVDEGSGVLTQARVPELCELLDSPSPRLPRPASESESELVKNVLALAPEAIDSVRARRGETLRFRGLPFARVRSVAGREQLWFGAEGARARRLLDEDNRADFFKLVAELEEHRRADADDRRHALYRAAPEAWLESLLRRDIT